MTVVTRYPTTNAVASTDWNNKSNAHADDGADASGTLSTTNANFYKDFGFDAVLPANASIDAVKVIVEHFDGDAGNAMSSRPFVADVAQTSRVFSQAAGGYQVDVNDHTADRAWARADLLDEVFDVLVGGSNAAVAVIVFDYVKVEVTYSLPDVPEGFGHRVVGWAAQR